MPKAAITVEHLSKAYRIGRKEETHNTLTGAMLSWARAPLRNFRQLRTLDAASALEEEVVWSLRDVSFEIQPGEVVGIIGRNGAGKSTLLKILSRITAPTSGRAVIRGRVSSLLEVGTGFHPELSGRENVYMNGTILGMRKREIDRKFDEIVDFSGVEKFIDTPVKRYSSGMKVRLAFSVAAHLEPEILVVDEVLAVGDAEFQNRCLGRMRDVATGGRTVLFVSHNMAAVEGLCSHGVLLERGSVRTSGPIHDVISQYTLNHVGSRSGGADLAEHPHRTIHGHSVFRSIQLMDDERKPLITVESGGPLVFEIALRAETPIHGAVIGIHLCDTYGRRVMTCHSGYQTRETLHLRGSRVVRCRIPSCRLMPGVYSITLGLADNATQFDRIEPAMEFEIVPRDVYRTGLLPPLGDGVFLPEVRWTLNESEQAATEHAALR